MTLKINVSNVSKICPKFIKQANELILTRSQNKLFSIETVCSNKNELIQILILPFMINTRNSFAKTISLLYVLSIRRAEENIISDTRYYK